MSPEAGIELYRLISDWNPLQLEAGFDYDPEIYDAISAIYESDDVHVVSRAIQEIFNQSFETVIPLAEIDPITERALVLKRLYNDA
ncbi:DUF1871 family protein [Salinicoccus sp. CNSTN-B1]